MIKKILLLTLIIDLSLAGGLPAVMPPEKMAQRNLEAECILIGKVKGVGQILLPEKYSAQNPQKGVFCLNVRHVVKGYKAVKPGDNVHIIFKLPDKPKDGIMAEKSGVLPVEVDTGDLVIAYVNPFKSSRFYRPLAQGESVRIIVP